MSEPGATVLVADDEDDIRLLCRVNLEAAGFTVLEACDADELMQALSSQVPDLVLLDVSMPGRDGLEVLRDMQMHAELRSVPVVMLSAHVDESMRSNAIALGATDYMPKPFRPADLVALVSRVTGR